MKSKYKITIEDIINKKKVYEVDILERDDRTKFSTNIIFDLIERYENKNFRMCNQCLRYEHIKKMSQPEKRKMWFCQNCLEEIMDGSQEVRNIN